MRQVSWLFLALPFLQMPEVYAFSLRAKHSRSNMTLSDLQNMDYQAHKLQDAHKTIKSQGAHAGHGDSTRLLLSTRYAHAWNHFKRKHHGKHVNRAHEAD